MIMFDADHFKAVNDRHGHAGGDAVLRHLAAALKLTFRDIDVVARVGGEEFAVLLPSTDLAGAAAVANRLRVLVEEAVVKVDGAAHRTTPSAPAWPPWTTARYRPGRPDEARRPGAVRGQGARQQPGRVLDGGSPAYKTRAAQPKERHDAA